MNKNRYLDKLINITNPILHLQTKQDINSANSSPNFHKSKDNAIDDFVILDEVGDEQVPTSSLDNDDRDDISLSEADDQDLEKVSSDEDENADDESFENISSPEHVTNNTGPKLDFENVDSPEEHAVHEDLEAVDSPEEGKKCYFLITVIKYMF